MQAGCMERAEELTKSVADKSWGYQWGVRVLGLELH